MSTSALQFETLPRRFINMHDKHAYHVEVTKVSGGPKKFLAYAYQCFLVEDNDGAPTCYGRNRTQEPFQLQQNLHPLERHLSNAASPWQNLYHNHDFKWTSICCMTPEEARQKHLTIDDWEPLRDRHGRYPVVQQQGSPAPGYFVSTTATPADPNLPAWDQRRYWDASAIPFAVYATRDWHGTGVAQGDFGLAIRPKSATSCGFFFGDSRRHHVGECSRKLVRTLSPSGSGNDRVIFLVLPGSNTTSGSQPAQNLIQGTLSKRIGQALTAGDAEDLIRFLALGASRTRYDHALKLSAKEQDKERLNAHAIEHALNLYGVDFPQGSFPATSASYA